jgi:hypothetical protein
VPHKQGFGCILQLLHVYALATRGTGSGNNGGNTRGYDSSENRTAGCDFLKRLETAGLYAKSDGFAPAMVSELTPANFEPRFKLHGREKKGDSKENDRVRITGYQILSFSLRVRTGAVCTTTIISTTGPTKSSHRLAAAACLSFTPPSKTQTCLSTLILWRSS